MCTRGRCLLEQRLEQSLRVVKGHPVRQLVRLQAGRGDAEQLVCLHWQSAPCSYDARTAISHLPQAEPSPVAVMWLACLFALMLPEILLGQAAWLQDTVPVDSMGDRFFGLVRYPWAPASALSMQAHQS